MMLIVTSNYGCIDSIIKPAIVYPVPVADFEFFPRVVTIVEPFIFITNTSLGVDTNYWDLGDGFSFSTTSDSGFIHAYSDVDTGTYTIELIVMNSFGCSDTISDYVIIKGDYVLFVPNRSEERRVGKECRSRWSPYH